jgi:hypothetical protein
MMIPGYSADASLYRSAGHYRAGLAGLARPDGVALPQQMESLITPPWLVCVPRLCPPSGGVQYCCYWGPFGHRCFTRTCPPDPCAHCRTPAQCCICAGGTWTGSVCI